MYPARDPVADYYAHYYARDYARCARVFGRINFGDLVKKIRQFAKLKSPQKFPAIRYMVILE